MTPYLTGSMRTWIRSGRRRDTFSGGNGTLAECATEAQAVLASGSVARCAPSCSVDVDPPGAEETHQATALKRDR